MSHTYTTFDNYTIYAKVTNAAGQSAMAPIGFLARGMFVNDKNK